ncbi:MAG: M20/M25/M40 family metallo-hydrolase [Candidatus Kryptonium sp.]|nr:M20/M25/M40 family metallo-hydrolase [Candidatus Kryptonium sp.]
MKKIAGFTLILIFITNCAKSQVKFDSMSAWNFNKILTSEKFQGRKSGTPGGERASEWIAEKFKEFGLIPFGDKGTYFQNFKILATQDKASKLTLINGRKGKTKYSLGDDFTILTNSGSGKVKSKVVFVGYGISAPEKGRDDYANVDVKGKIVLLLAGGPEDEEGKFETESSRGYKIKKAFEKGASAVFYVQGDRPIRGGAITEEYYTPQLPAFWISRKIVDDIFYNTGISFDALRAEINFRERSFEIDKVFEIEAKVEKLDGWTKNVVGLLPGNDENLKNEYIIVGAHMDHNGVDAEGFIYPGADDNASGTCLVMELARSMIANGEKPKRSIIFVLFAAEEQGLLGSKYFASHLPVPEENIVAMFNFDMVGRGNGNINIAGTENFPEIWDIMKGFFPENKLKNLGKFRAGANSDHYPFQERGIPAFFFISAGQHPEYHRTDDTNDKIQPFVLGEVGNTAYQVILGLANYPRSLKKGNRFIDYLYSNAQTAIYIQVHPDSITKEWLYNFWKEVKNNGVEAVIFEINSNKFDDVVRTIYFVDSLATREYRHFNVVSSRSDFNTSPDVLNIIFSARADAFQNLPQILSVLSKSGLKFVYFDEATSGNVKNVANIVNDFYLDVVPVLKGNSSRNFKITKTHIIVDPDSIANDQLTFYLFTDAGKFLSSVNFIKPEKVFVSLKPDASKILISNLREQKWEDKKIQRIFGRSIYGLLK